MKLQTVFIPVLGILCLTAFGQKSNTKKQLVRESKITFVKHEADQRVDVLVDGKLFTAYCWPGTVYKPILYPILTAAGTAVTRGFPLKPRPGERQDHMHQVGNWLNYGNVNGYGLFAANPFGAKDFTEKKDSLNYFLSAGHSVTFRYRIIISSGTLLTDQKIDAYANDFWQKYN